MHYLTETAPRSPQAQGRNLQRPQNYNYATRNANRPRQNPYASQPQQQIRPNPYNANRLSEDRTIEDIEASANDDREQKFIIMLIIGIVVVILIIASGIGIYFLIRHKNSKDGMKQRQSQTISSSSSSEESEESVDSNEAVISQSSEATIPSQEHDDLMIHAMYFRDENDPTQFLDYYPYSPIEYTEILSLDTIANIFHSRHEWKLENTQQQQQQSSIVSLNDGCQYFKHYANKPLSPQNTISKPVEFCSDVSSSNKPQYQLMQSSDDPLIYIIIHKNQHYQHQHYQHQQEGVKLRLFRFNFEIDNGHKLYSLSSADLTEIVNKNNNKLPTTQQLKQEKQLFIPLSNNKQFTLMEMKTESEGHKQLSSNTVSNGNIIGHANFLLFNKYNGKEYGSMRENQHSDCNLDLLSTLYFMELFFFLDLTMPKRGDKQHTERYECHYIYDPNNKQDDPISFNGDWWEMISTKNICEKQQQTNHHQEVGHIKREKVCDIFEETEQEQYDKKRRMMDDSNDYSNIDPSICECIDGCGFEWLIEEGSELIMQNCLPTVSAINFEWALSPLSLSDYHHRLKDFDPLHKYEHRRWERQPNIDIINGKHLPFYPCQIPKVRDRIESPPANIESPEDIGSREQSENSRSYSPRRLTGKNTDHPSKAQNQRNLYLIIASTIFCVIVGIQSFYWLSNL